MFRPRRNATTIITLAGILVVAGMGFGYA